MPDSPILGFGSLVRYKNREGIAAPYGKVVGFEGDGTPIVKFTDGYVDNVPKSLLEEYQPES